MRRIVIKPAVAFITLAAGCTILTCQYSPSSTLRRADQPASEATPNSTQASVSIPEGWKKFDADGEITFYLPPDMKDTGITGTENFYREYEGGNMHVSLDYKPIGFLAYESREQAFGKGFQEITTQIDGRKAFIFVYEDQDRHGQKQYNSELYVGDLPNRQVILQMRASSLSPAAIEEARTIFNTITFAPEYNVRNMAPESAHVICRAKR